MKRDPRVCTRLLPFNEHRNLAEVIESERLLKLSRSRKLPNGQHNRLNALLSRATDPDNDPERPSAA